MMGMPVGEPRPPRLPLPEHERKDLATILHELGLIASTS